MEQSTSPTPGSGFLNATEFRAILKVFIPLSIEGLGSVGIGLTDMIMVGWLGTNSLAAVGLFSAIYGFIGTIASGTLFQTLVFISQARGGGRLRIVPRIIWQAIWICVIWSVLTCVVLWNLEAILVLAGQDAIIAWMVGSYGSYFLWQVFQKYTSSVFSFVLLAMGRATALPFIIWSQLALNAILNYVLIFGKFGFPEMGLMGAALASVIVVSIGQMALFGVLVYHRFFSSSALFLHFWRPRWTTLGLFFRLGWPRSIRQLLLGGMYSAATLLAGWLGVQALASHVMVYQIVSVATNVISTPLSKGITAYMGVIMGQRNHAGMWTALNSSLFILLLFVLPLVVILQLFSPLLVELFVGSDSKAYLLLSATAGPLFVIASFFILVNGLQKVVSHALHGLSDVKVPVLIAVLAYWGVGVTTGVVLGFVMDGGVLGLWFGLTIGMIAAASALFMRFRWVVRRIQAGESLAKHRHLPPQIRITKTMAHQVRIPVQ
uniref:Multidrug resistance protein, MATE family n=1 Tax=Candidatus Kentrum sp. DK TaxID=2126562 RepID=A0A450S8L7_9GAMM|nr:MAG: multidrug resistance protein, MATE family [Candidatus Kentron sp. DK]